MLARGLAGVLAGILPAWGVFRGAPDALSIREFRGTAEPERTLALPPLPRSAVLRSAVPDGAGASSAEFLAPEAMTSDLR